MVRVLGWMKGVDGDGGAPENPNLGADLKELGDSSGGEFVFFSFFVISFVCFLIEL